MMTTVSNIACVRGVGDALPALCDEATATLGGAAPKLVVAFASSKLDLGATLSALKARFGDAAVIGSSTSGEFTHRGDGSGTVALFALAGDFVVRAGLGRDLGADPERAVDAALAGLPGRVDGHPHRTNLVLLDPFAGHGEEAALIIATRMGDSPLVGGAAGDDLAMKSTIVGAGTEASADAIVVASIFSKQPLGVGVCHGHAPFSQPLTVTKVDGSVVLEVDGRPAWDVWLEKSSARAREVGLDPDANPGAYLLRFEAGLRIGDEFKVRAPLSPRPDGGILFATPMLEGTVFTIMESAPAAQIESAITAAQRARSGLGEAPIAGALVFDCICRKLILGDRYDEAIRGVSSALGDAPLAGFETYGEIAMNSGDMSGFHNTTTVVLAFPKDPSDADR
jgi:methyl-accepting chemotaxis protein